MAIYTILFGLSIFMIALVMVIIKKMFLHWKEEHKNESMVVNTGVDRPAVSVMIITDKCVVESRLYADGTRVFELVGRSELSLPRRSRDRLDQPGQAPLEAGQSNGPADQ